MNLNKRTAVLITPGMFWMSIGVILFCLAAFLFLTVGAP